jgi:hypothetical protein
MKLDVDERADELALEIGNGKRPSFGPVTPNNLSAECG